MSNKTKTTIAVQTTINAPVEKVWAYRTDPKHIVNWAFASEDWHAPAAESDLKVGGRFKTTMAAKDGSMQFDFTGQYTKVVENKTIEYVIDDGRAVKIELTTNGGQTTLVESFEAESQNSVELQRGGWQAILDNFKIYAESLQPKFSSILSPYLNFNGDCKAAMEFYRDVFGGELIVQTFGEAGQAKSEKDKNRVMHALLRSPDVAFMASDGMPDKKVVMGDNIHLSLGGSDEKKLSGHFNNLAKGGTVVMPLAKQFWGDTFGMLTDKFGVHWMVNISAK